MVVLAALVVFVILAADVHFSSDVAIDVPVLAALEAARSPALTALMAAVTRLGDAAVLTAVATMMALGLAVARYWRAALYMAIAASGAGVLNTALKAFFARARPDLAIVEASGYAFPSGHSMGSAATYGAIALIVATRFPAHRRLLIASCLVAVGAVGLSRAYLHVHYPSDVLAGWALGLAWALWLERPILGVGLARLVRGDVVVPAQDEERLG
jgi:undecaprenyl-diphosphatase